MQIVKQYRPLEKKNRKLKELKQDLIFSWFVDHKKLYPNCKDSNYKNVPSTTPTSKMSTSSTQNETTLRGSEIEYTKRFLRCFTKSFKTPPCLFFFYSLLWPQLHDI